MRQLDLFSGQAEPRSEALVAQERALAPPDGAALFLAARLSSLLREPVEVELTDNAWTMVSFRRVQGRLHFRLHHMFARAREQVIDALAGFTGRNRRQHGRAIDAYVREHRQLIRNSSARESVRLATQGRVHDLMTIYDELNARHFGGRIEARIGWGRRSPQGRRRSIKMGVYFHETKIIRIHPALDDERVPRFFVEMVVFHEMLHQVFPPERGASARNRRTVHGPEFRAAERRYPDYERARAWEAQHLSVLLRPRSVER